MPKRLLVSVPRRHVSILRVSIPLQQLPFRISLPLSAYTEGSVWSVDALHDRLQNLGILPDGK